MNGPGSTPTSPTEPPARVPVVLFGLVNAPAVLLLAWAGLSAGYTSWLLGGLALAAGLAGSVALYRCFRRVLAGCAEERARLRDALAEAARAKTSLLVNVSHELRTPLNGILGMAEALRLTPLAAEQAGLLRTLTLSAEALLVLVEQVLDYARLEAGEAGMSRQVFSLRGTLREAVAPLLPQAEAKGLRLAEEVAADLPDHFLGDPARLRQALAHLVGNAVKFTAEGAVTVRASAGSGDRFHLCLEVADTGVGVPADKQERIFAAFEQADASLTRRHGGLGLGLSLAARLVELMGGSIALVESAVGRGSTFRVLVPLDVAEGALLEAARPAILVALADEAERGAVKALLDGWGWHAVAVGSAQAARGELLRAVVQGAPYRLALLQERLPDADLGELLRQLDGCGLRCPVVVLHDGTAAQQPPRDWPACVRAALPRSSEPPALRAALVTAG